MIVLTTERMLLRHFVADDLQALFALYRDPEIRRYYPDGTRTLEETREELEWFQHGHPRRPELGLWATVDRQSGEFLGRCGLLPWTIAGVEEVELSFMIKKERWREGLAAEAARAIVQHTRHTLGLRRLICLVMPGNDASAALATRMGMAFEGDISDEAGPCHLYGMRWPEG